MSKSHPIETSEDDVDLVEFGLAMQEQGLKLLLAEMHALATLIPGSQTDHPTEAEVEDSFDNMPV